MGNSFLTTLLCLSPRDPGAHRFIHWILSRVLDPAVPIHLADHPLDARRLGTRGWREISAIGIRSALSGHHGHQVSFGPRLLVPRSYLVLNPSALNVALARCAASGLLNIWVSLFFRGISKPQPFWHS